MPKIYVASSWRNPYDEQVVKRLREEGHEVYDFRNPPHGGNGFHWTDVDENAPIWTLWSGPTLVCLSFLAAAVPTLKPDGWPAAERKSWYIFRRWRSRS